MAITTLTGDTRELACPEDETCGFEGEMEVAIGVFELEAECPQCGHSFTVELADLYFTD